MSSLQITANCLNHIVFLLDPLSDFHCILSMFSISFLCVIGLTGAWISMRVLLYLTKHDIDRLIYQDSSSIRLSIFSICF